MGAASMSAPDLTIAICTADRPDALSRLLGDLARAEAGTWSREVLVVDNGATAVHADVRVVTSPRHNIARARNLALAEARGRLLLWLDDDQRVSPSFFVELERAWRHRPTWSAGVRVAVRPAFDGPVDARMARFFAPLVGDEGALVWRATFATNGFLVERDVLRALPGPSDEGPFDAWFGTRGAEDTDLFMRASDAGLRFTSTRLVWVDEVIPASRARLVYMMRHAFRIGFTDTIIDLARASRSAVVMDLCAHLAFEATFFPVSMRTPNGRMHRGLSLVRQAGKLWALVGRDYEHYRARP